MRAKPASQEIREIVHEADPGDERFRQTETPGLDVQHERRTPLLATGPESD